MHKPLPNPQQHFREECFADRGYRFLRKDGEDALWIFRGFSLEEIVRIKPDGNVVVEKRTDKADKPDKE